MKDEPLVEVRGLRKDYRGLRPLRIEHFELRAAETVALVGFDQITAEVLVNLLTGAILPDEGEVRVFGQATTSIADGEAWLKSLDRFGILSERAVLLDELTVEQNLAMPFTLELDPIPDNVRNQVARLTEEVGLAQPDGGRRVSSLPPAARQRVRLARSVALDPLVLLAEHPNATLPAGDLPAFAADLVKLITARRLATLTLTADATFASAVASRVLTLQPATGVLKPASGWRRTVTRFIR
jgi:ABC-type transporter Mla maintaining outer membrane lipid asymmetry ATPase subunit MlaF